LVPTDATKNKRSHIKLPKVHLFLSSGKKEGHLHNIPKGNLPFQTIHIDHYGPLEKSGKGYKYIFSIIDSFTKFIKLYPCKSTKTEESIKHLCTYFNNYSKPNRIISDRGTSFTSNAFKNFMSNESIEHILIAVGTPRANGQVERFNKILTPMLAKLSETPAKWDNVLQSVEFTLNNSICRATNETPSRLLFGINQTGVINDKLKLMLDPYSDENRDLIKIREQASQTIEKTQNINKIAYDNTNIN